MPGTRIMLVVVPSRIYRYVGDRQSSTGNFFSSRPSMLEDEKPTRRFICSHGTYEGGSYRVFLQTLCATSAAAERWKRGHGPIRLAFCYQVSFRARANDVLERWNLDEGVLISYSNRSRVVNIMGGGRRFSDSRRGIFHAKPSVLGLERP